MDGGERLNKEIMLMCSLETWPRRPLPVLASFTCRSHTRLNEGVGEERMTNAERKDKLMSVAIATYTNS